MKRLMVVCLALSSLAMAQTTVFGATPNAVDNLTVSGTLAVGTTVLPGAITASVQDAALWKFQDLRLAAYNSTLAALAIPSPYGPGTAANLTNEVVHPTLVYEPMSWHGYKYWLAYTPYPSSQSDYENPSIAVSNDGVTWTTPTGLVNPLLAKPAGGFNSDPYITLSPDKSKMYLIYREQGTANYLKLMESADGVHWSAPVTLATGTLASQDFASPSLWFDGANWVVITHNLKGSGYPVQRMATSGSDVYSGWGDPTTVTPTHPASSTWWHSDLVRLSDGRILGLVQDGGNSGGALYWWISYDNGATFSVKAADTQRSNYYRSAIAVKGDKDKEQLAVILGRLVAPFSFYLTTADLSAQTVVRDSASRRTALVYAATNGIGSNYLAVDSFNRADNATSLGSTIDGKSYTVDTTPKWAISSNHTASDGTNNTRALLDLGAGNSDFTYELRIPQVGQQAFLIFRATDAYNYWRVGSYGATPSGTNRPFQLQKIVGGAVGNVDVNLGSEMAAGDIVRVECYGPAISVFKNDVLFYRIYDATYVSNTKIGFQASGATATYFDDLQVWK